MTSIEIDELKRKISDMKVQIELVENAVEVAESFLVNEENKKVSVDFPNMPALDRATAGIATVAKNISKLVVAAKETVTNKNAAIEGQNG